MTQTKSFFLSISLAILMNSASPVLSYAHSEYWEQRVSLFDCLPIGEDDIVFLGNSITDGGEFAELFKNPKVKNRGISGDVISGIRDRLDQVTSGRPAKIFLLIGINDISHNIPVNKLAIEYENLLQAIRQKSPDTKLYIQSVMPINNDFGRYKNLMGKEKNVLQLNERLAHLSSEYGATYIDLFSTLADSETGKLKKEFTNDGLHLTGNGYKAWVASISRYVYE